MTEQTDVEIEFSDQDKLDLAALGIVDGAEAKYHTVLEAWQAVLKPAAAAAAEKPGTQWCNRIVGGYHEVTFADMYDFRDNYFGKIAELTAILDLEIAEDPDCLTYTSAAEDAAENATHYKNLILLWELQVLAWELAWDPTVPGAGVDLAAIAEVHRMFAGEQGLIPHLGAIGFEYTEADQADLQAALQELREGGGR